MNPTDSPTTRVRLAVRRRYDSWRILVRFEGDDTRRFLGAWTNPYVWTEIPILFASMSAAWAFLNRAGVKA